jgi:hypothetical protein
VRFAWTIGYSPDLVERSRLPMEARGRLEYADRVPVGFCLVPR